MTLELLLMLVRFRQVSADQEEETMLNKTMKMLTRKIRQKMEVKKRRQNGMSNPKPKTTSNFKIKIQRK